MFPSVLNVTLLMMEAQQVIWLRCLRLASGGTVAEAEAARMVTEKLAANGNAAAAILGGAHADQVIHGYRRKVRANLRRLQRPSR